MEFKSKGHVKLQGCQVAVKYKSDLYHHLVGPKPFSIPPTRQPSKTSHSHDSQYNGLYLAEEPSSPFEMMESLDFMNYPAIYCEDLNETAVPSYRTTERNMIAPAPLKKIDCRTLLRKTNNEILKRKKMEASVLDNSYNQLVSYLDTTKPSIQNSNSKTMSKSYEKQSHPNSCRGF